MMPLLQTDETKTVAVEPAVFEAQADTLELDASNAQPAEVEEIRTEEMSTEKTKPRKRAPEKKENPSPLLLDPYQFDQCTITIVYTRLDDQQASVSLLGAILDKESFPEPGPRNSIHSDGIDRVEWVGLATSNLPFQLPSTVSTPGFREEPFFVTEHVTQACIRRAEVGGILSPRGPVPVRLASRLHG